MLDGPFGGSRAKVDGHERNERSLTKMDGIAISIGPSSLTLVRRRMLRVGFPNYEILHQYYTHIIWAILHHYITDMTPKKTCLLYGFEYLKLG